MSVLNCHRSGCERIMCDLYSSEYGYICHYCYEELLKSGGKMTIEDFMMSEANFVSSHIGWELYCKEEFKLEN